MFKIYSALYAFVRPLRTLVIRATCVLLFCGRAAFAQEVVGGCGSLGNAFGPFDYRADRYIPEATFQSHAAQLNIVERAHFTAEVEALVRGKSDVLGGDIGYTLRAFPNHHRALLAMATLGDKERTDTPKGSIYSVDCWFRRAVSWRADDNIVRMIYAKYLVDKGRTGEAEQHLAVVAGRAGDNAFTYRNLGLIYFDMKNYDKALAYAHIAYSLGLDISALRDQLKKVDKWSEPAEGVTGKTGTQPN